MKLLCKIWIHFHKPWKDKFWEIWTCKCWDTYIPFNKISSRQAKEIEIQIKEYKPKLEAKWYKVIWENIVRFMWDKGLTWFNVINKNWNKEEILLHEIDNI